MSHFKSRTVAALVLTFALAVAGLPASASTPEPGENVSERDPDSIAMEEGSVEGSEPVTPTEEVTEATVLDLSESASLSSAPDDPEAVDSPEISDLPADAPAEDTAESQTLGEAPAETPAEVEADESSDSGEDGEVPSATAEDGESPAVAEDAEPAEEDLGSLPQGDVYAFAESDVESEIAAVGLTWAGEASDTEVFLRSFDGSAWSEWENIEVAASELDEERPGTEPIIVVEAERVQVAASRGDAAPSDAELSVWDPGEGAPAPLPNDASGATAGQRSVVRLQAASSPVRVYSRAEWGADERLMTWTPREAQVHGVVVHHTAGTNNYTAAQVPAIIRGIYAYHAVTRGWGDIGYNLLVDKFGRVWEGRAGGIDRAIQGAHATSWNSSTFGISVLGDYTQVSLPNVAMEALAQAIAWKFAVHGVAVSDTVTVSGNRQPSITGHRNVGNTACPGYYIYSRFDELRSKVEVILKSVVVDSAVGSVDRDLLGTGQQALVLTGSNGKVQLWAPPVAHKPATWGKRSQIGSGWTGHTVAPGDWDGDGIPDAMLARSDGRLMLYPGRSGERWATPRQIGTGWHRLDRILGGVDWDGDGHTDLLARVKSNGQLWLYPGNGRGGFLKHRQVGTGWSRMTVMEVVDDGLGGLPVLRAIDSSGQLYTYPANGTGGFKPRISHGGGWGNVQEIVGIGDRNGDGIGDMFGITDDGRLLYYSGLPNGRYRPSVQVGTGWASFRHVFAASQSDPKSSVWGIAGARNLFYSYPVSFGGSGTTRAPTLNGPSNIHDTFAGGDWNGDGSADLMARTTNGDLILYGGNGKGSFATGVKIGNAWQIFTQVAATQSYDRSGSPALLTLSSTGEVRLYNSNGSGRFTNRIAVGTYPGTKVVVPLSSHRIGLLSSNGTMKILSINSKGAVSSAGEVKVPGNFDGGVIAGFDSNGTRDFEAFLVGKNGNLRHLVTSDIGRTPDPVQLMGAGAVKGSAG